MGFPFLVVDIVEYVKKNESKTDTSNPINTHLDNKTSFPSTNIAHLLSTPDLPKSPSSAAHASRRPPSPPPPPPSRLCPRKILPLAPLRPSLPLRIIRAPSSRPKIRLRVLRVL
eukprot:1045816-Amorphochlora_amoeboformis.AAC.1